MHTHCVIYQNGHRALINISGGKWRMEWGESELDFYREKVNALAVETLLMKLRPAQLAA